MPLKITQRKAGDVPSASSSGKVNEDLVPLKIEMTKLATGMVLEIETGSEKAVRGTKMLVTKAAKELGTQWQHWNVGTTVFAKPREAVRRRGRPPKVS
jgi:TusA-related sulfurtransferase